MAVPGCYVVGSVHFLADEAVDFHGYPEWEPWNIWRGADPEKVWSRYFETLGEAARTGMFDILAHPDLVKVWGDRVPIPDGDLRRFYERALDGIAESDVAIEVSTAGLRKPVAGEVPGRALPGDVPRGRASGGALERRPHPRPTRLRVRTRRELAWWPRRGRAGGVRRAPAASGAARGQHWTAQRDRLRLAPLRRGPSADSRGRRDFRRTARARGPLGRRRPDPRGDGCALGAAALGDIGAHFPDTDERWAGRRLG